MGYYMGFLKIKFSLLWNTIGRLDQQRYTTIYLMGRIVITLSSLSKISQEVCSLARGNYFCELEFSQHAGLQRDF